jgi:hypothetical protein
MDPSPLTPMPSSAPPKKKPRTSLGGLSNPSTPGEKREIVTWTKFHTIPAADMGISPENAQSVEKETLKVRAPRGLRGCARGRRRRSKRCARRQ